MNNLTIDGIDYNAELELLKEYMGYHIDDLALHHQISYYIKHLGILPITPPSKNFTQWRFEYYTELLGKDMDLRLMFGDNYIDKKK